MKWNFSDDKVYLFSTLPESAREGNTSADELNFGSGFELNFSIFVELCDRIPLRYRWGQSYNGYTLIRIRRRVLRCRR